MLSMPGGFSRLLTLDAANLLHETNFKNTKICGSGIGQSSQYKAIGEQHGAGFGEVV
jgi:hypothetical protein